LKFVQPSSLLQIFFLALSRKKFAPLKLVSLVSLAVLITDCFRKTDGDVVPSTAAPAGSTSTARQEAATALTSGGRTAAVYGHNSQYATICLTFTGSLLKLHKVCLLLQLQSALSLP